MSKNKTWSYVNFETRVYEQMKREKAAIEKRSKRKITWTQMMEMLLGYSKDNKLVC